LVDAGVWVIWRAMLGGLIAVLQVLPGYHVWFDLRDLLQS